MDSIIFYGTTVAQGFLLFSCLTRRNYTWGMRYFVLIQCLQACELLPVLLPGDSQFAIWFFLDKVNVILEISCIVAICATFPSIALLFAIHSGLKLVTYAGVDVDSMFQKDAIYYARAILNLVTAVWIAYRMYERTNDGTAEDYPEAALEA